jgi:hypothetical protein
MKIHQIAAPGPKLSLEQISAFEKEIGLSLPEEYKQFLLAQNGGICEPKFGLPFAGTMHDVPAFLILYPDDPDIGIRQALRSCRHFKPKKFRGYVPIAETLSGCEICIACEGKHAGAIFITAYKYRVCENWDRIPIDVSMVRLTRTFAELFDYMVKLPNPYCRIEDLGKNGTPDDLKHYLAEGNSINAKGKNDLSILCEAIKFRNYNMIQACIESGASFSQSLQIAVGNNCIPAIKMLVKAGVDLNERDEYGDMSLDYVVGTGYPGEEAEKARATYDLLIKLGAVEN